MLENCPHTLAQTWDAQKLPSAETWGHASILMQAYGLWHSGAGRAITEGQSYAARMKAFFLLLEHFSCCSVLSESD